MKNKTKKTQSGRLGFNSFFVNSMCQLKILCKYNTFQSIFLSQDIEFCNSFHSQEIESHNEKGEISTFELENPGNVHESATWSESTFLQLFRVIKVLSCSINSKNEVNTSLLN